MMVLTHEFACCQLNTQMRRFTYPKLINYCLQCTRIFLCGIASSGMPFISTIMKVSMSRVARIGTYKYAFTWRK